MRVRRPVLLPVLSALCAALVVAVPNVYSEIGAVPAELGRQPRFARRFLIRYRNRILFGKDSRRPEEYATYFRPALRLVPGIARSLFSR